MLDPHDPGTAAMQLAGGGGALIGYARVSTSSQDNSMQVDALRAAGCRHVFEDVASGARAARPGLDSALAYLRPSDTLVVWKIDRLGRSLPHLIQVVDNLRRQGVGFRSLTNSSIDTSRPDGLLMFNVIAALAEFERELNRERTREAIRKARDAGRPVGRRKVITNKILERAKKHIEAGHSVRQAATLVGVGKTALYAALQEGNSQ